MTARPQTRSCVPDLKPALAAPPYIKSAKASWAYNTAQQVSGPLQKDVDARAEETGLNSLNEVIHHLYYTALKFLLSTESCFFVSLLHLAYFALVVRLILCSIFY